MENKITCEKGELVVLLDATGSFVGFAVGTKIYDDKGVFVSEVKPEITIKRIIDMLLNRKSGSVV